MKTKLNQAGYTRKAKQERNKKMLAYYLAHPGIAYLAVGKIFHVSQKVAWTIIQREKVKKEAPNV